MVDHEYDHKDVCPHCLPVSEQSILNKNLKDKLLSFFGVCGSLSCYFAMFPLVLVGIVGVLGISTVGIVPALNAYMVSPFFNPILLISIALIITAVFPLGRTAMVLAVIAGVLIFISMNIYMRSWLFLSAFVFLAMAQIVGAYTKNRGLSWKGIILSVAPLPILTFILAISTYVAPTPQNNNVSQPQALPPQQQSSSPMLRMR